jgi:hypothetical protein
VEVCLWLCRQATLGFEVEGILERFHYMRVQSHLDGYEPPQMRSHDHVMLSLVCFWQLGKSCGHHADCTTLVRCDLLLPVMAPKAALRHLAHLQARSTMHITAAVLRCAATPQANYGAYKLPGRHCNR